MSIKNTYRYIKKIFITEQKYNLVYIFLKQRQNRLYLYKIELTKTVTQLMGKICTLKTYK